MNSSEAQLILRRARDAQQSWGAMSVSRRCEILSSIRVTLASECDSIASLIARETLKHPLDALSGDVLVTLEHLRYCQRHASAILRSRKHPKPFLLFRGARFETDFEAHGVALVVGASNYPLQLSLIPVVTALVAGNSVVLKCSERTPETAEAIARLMGSAELPAGLVQVLAGGPEQVSALLDARPDFICFTGSSKNGLQVAQRAATHLIPGIFELGGKDASIVFADCDRERAVEGITYGAFLNGGRVCVGTKRVYVESSIYNDFVRRLVERADKLRIGHGLDSDLPPLSEDGEVQLRLQVHEALAGGATLRWPASKASLRGPVILTGVAPDSSILTEEIFGPILCVAPFSDECEAISLANSSPFALSSSIWTRDRDRARRTARQVNAGSCAVNDAIRVIANPYTPFGGNGLSGYGRYHGAEGLRAFSRTKTVMSTHTRRRREVNWFPFRKETSRQLSAFLKFRHAQPGILARVARLLAPVIVSLALCHSAMAQPPASAHLTILVELTPHAHGEVGYLVFASPSGFPGDREKAVRRGFLPIPAAGDRMQIGLDLAPGRYAVSVYEDLNGNHRLDHNWLGIPREPVGISNNSRARSGPPKFSESSFHLETGSQTITIQMVEPS